MTTWKRRIESMVLQEIAIAGSFARALPARDELHGRIDQESIGERFEFQLAGLLSTCIIGFYAVRPQPYERAAHAAKTNAGELSITIDITTGKHLLVSLLR